MPGGQPLYRGMRYFTDTSRVLLAAVVLLGHLGCKQDGTEAEQPAPVETSPPTSVTSNVDGAIGAFGLQPFVKSVESDKSGEFNITYEWALTRKREKDFRVFVHFTDEEGKILFQNDHDPDPSTSQWEPGKIQQGPYLVYIPEGLSGDVMVRMGLYQSEQLDVGVSARDQLDGKDDGELRIIVGHLAIADGNAAFKPVK